MTESQRYITVSLGMEEMPFQNMPVQRLMVAMLSNGRKLLWVRNPLGGNSKHWQASQQEVGRIIPNRRHGNEKTLSLIRYYKTHYHK
jgi:hypothetical protein